MKIVAIFEKITDRLFAAKFDDSAHDELDRAFNAWREADYLREFFMRYRADLRRFDPAMKVQSAILAVTSEVESIYDALAQSALIDRLDELFKPLDNREVSEPRYELQRFKAKSIGRKSMIRLYAVKFMDCYVISGSALKITDKMDRPHLRVELHKLDLLKQFLQRGGIETTFVYLDIGT